MLPNTAEQTELAGASPDAADSSELAWVSHDTEENTELGCALWLIGDCASQLLAKGNAWHGTDLQGTCVLARHGLETVWHTWHVMRKAGTLYYMARVGMLQHDLERWAQFYASMLDLGSHGTKFASAFGAQLGLQNQTPKR